MTRWLRSVVERVASGGYAPARTLWRGYRPQVLWRLTSPAAAPTLRFVEEHGLIVRRGPFAGMRYPHSAVGRANFLPAKLLGSYEEEIAPWIDALTSRSFTRLVNVGAGEGFYAVGFALRSPETLVLAFESTHYERVLCAELARENDVEITVSGTFTLGQLAELTPDSETLLLLDVEGAELELLRPDVVPGLTLATILAELHPHVDAALPDNIRERFRGTHDVELVWSRGRDAATYPERPDPILLSEGRTGDVLWALWTPR